MHSNTGSIDDYIFLSRQSSITFFFTFPVPTPPARLPCASDRGGSSSGSRPTCAPPWTSTRSRSRPWTCRRATSGRRTSTDWWCPVGARYSLIQRSGRSGGRGSYRWDVQIFDRVIIFLMVKLMEKIISHIIKVSIILSETFVSLFVPESSQHHNSQGCVLLHDARAVVPLHEPLVGVHPEPSGGRTERGEYT